MEGDRVSYEAFINRSSRLLDFSEKGQELLTLCDAKFVQARLNYTFQRMGRNKAQLLDLEEKKSSFVHFFTLLKKNTTNNAMTEMPSELKQALFLIIK